MKLSGNNKRNVTLTLGVLLALTATTPAFAARRADEYGKTGAEINAEFQATLQRAYATLDAWVALLDSIEARKRNATTTTPAPAPANP